MTPEAMVPEDQLMSFILGKWISKPIYIAAKLGIADILAKDSKDIEVLAKMTEVHPRALYRMLRALAGAGIFAETAPRRFKNTLLSECLTKDRLRSTALLFQAEWHDGVWNNLLYSIRTGKSAFEKKYHQSIFQWFDEHPEEERIFHEANSFKAAFSHRVVAECYDFTVIHNLTDVGGGLGGLIIEILKKYPHMQGVVAELPGTVRQLKKIILKHGLGDRLTAVACDFFEAVPKGADAYLLSHILHDWPDEQCITILKNCRNAMTSGKEKLLVIEAVIQPGNDFSINKFLDLEVLLMGGGCERTEAEFTMILKQSGFRLSKIIHTNSNIAVIEGIPE